MNTLDALPQIAADPLVQRLNISKADLEVERVQLKNRYKEGHPKVKKVVTQIEQLQDAINAQAEKIVAGMRADYQQLRRRERELLASINSQRKESIEDSRKTVQLEMLQREALSNKSLYEAILQKIKETDVASSLRENNVSIIERASVPVIPIRPQPTKTLTIALVLGLLSGCGLILLRDYLDNTLKAQDDVERHLHADCLAIVPKHDAASESIITEAYRTLRTSLLFTREREHGNMILVTSSIPQEGKSTTAVNLAKALAESGDETLVVDFDLRRSSIHAHLRLYREPGLADYCTRDLKLDVVTQSTREPHLSAVTSGKIPPNPLALLCPGGGSSSPSRRLPLFDDAESARCQRTTLGLPLASRGRRAPDLFRPLEHHKAPRGERFRRSPACDHRAGYHDAPAMDEAPSSSGAVLACARFAVGPCGARFELERRAQGCGRRDRERAPRCPRSRRYVEGLCDQAG